jgi:hypothetical protein
LNYPPQNIPTPDHSDGYITFIEPFDPNVFFKLWVKYAAPDGCTQLRVYQGNDNPPQLIKMYPSEGVVSYGSDQFNVGEGKTAIPICWYYNYGTWGEATRWPQPVPGPPFQITGSLFTDADNVPVAGLHGLWSYTANIFGGNPGPVVCSLAWINEPGHF